MKKVLLILCALGIIPITAYSQTSSNSCSVANSATPITVAGTYGVSAINGDAPNLICATNSGAASDGEWFKYSPSDDYYVTISSNLAINVGKDTRVHIYSGTCGSLVCVAGNDDVSPGVFLSSITFSVSAGEDYYIVWDDFWSASSFDFELSETLVPPIVSFTSSSISAPGADRGAVDMNGDFLDDIVSVSTSNVTITYQIPPANPGDPTTLDNANKVSYPSGGTYSASWSMAAGDYDRNGFNDLVYGNSSGAHVVKANSTGTGYSVAATSHSVFTQRTNFVDFNNDGNLDIFLCDDTAPNEYFIYRADDPETLEIETEMQLYLYEGANEYGIENGLGVYFDGGNYGSVWIDYDSDGDSDLFIAKCGGIEARRQNQLFENQGNFTFVEVSAASNLDDSLSTWSSAWGDYDSDGDLDCFVGSSLTSEAHKLMRNNNGVFEDITEDANLDVFTDKGHENQAFDFNNDGFIDIFSNGSMLINNGNGTFSVFSSGIPQEGAVGDFNNDGFLDVFNTQIYLNDGNTNNWLKLNLIGTSSNINGIGARVEVSSPSFNNTGAAKKAQIRDVQSAQGFAYMSSLNPHFGLGADDTITSVKVIWPSGAVDIIFNPPVNQTMSITEGETLSVETTVANDLILYPNPTKQFLNLNPQYNFQNAIYSVFDVNGRRVLNSRLNSNKIDVSKLSTGNYVLRIIDNDLIKTKKFIKQ